MNCLDCHKPLHPTALHKLIHECPGLYWDRDQSRCDECADKHFKRVLDSLPKQGKETPL